MAVYVPVYDSKDHSVRFLRETWENGWNHPFYVLTACRLPLYRHSCTGTDTRDLDSNTGIKSLLTCFYNPRRIRPSALYRFTAINSNPLSIQCQR
ncbi:hypothetical protein F383_11617 [Gossypium arboreum]|uniref:Uncharacterized protein n=1 Tax=Gossypium arboreum TaxID=29729 RepID=A0A0B0NBV5_GOSAR|nr:hypothetical protein F383_11617 [Gossypium arboreum]